jgi:hypothetical protein
MDDQKDTWHWMGVAISLSYTIGLHKNPEKSDMDQNKKRLWKRIWWSCFMRDLLVALGMRRPTRVKYEEYDMPILTEDDFELSPLSKNVISISQDCTLARDVDAQRELAQMCIAKAKLCICISHVLSVQYSVLVKHQGMQSEEGSTCSSAMLLPKKSDQPDEVKHCDVELSNWIDELPSSCVYSNDIAPGSSGAPLFVHRSLLHMIYFTTLSALHRPQALPCTSTTQSDKYRELQDLSRKKVREASRGTIRISQDLYNLGLEKYLPTTGVTVLLPAIMVQLLDIKSHNDDVRLAVMNGFCQCMLVLEKLRDNYSSADFAIQLLEVAIRKADIGVVIGRSQEAKIDIMKAQEMFAAGRTPHPSSEGLTHLQNDYNLCQIDPFYNAYSGSTLHENRDEEFLTNALPESNTTLPETEILYSSEGLSAFLDFDALNNEIWNVPIEEDAHGESGGLMGDMNWIDKSLEWSPVEDSVAGGESQWTGGLMGTMNWIDQALGWSPVEEPVAGGKSQWTEWAVWDWWGGESEG